MGLLVKQEKPQIKENKTTRAEKCWFPVNIIYCQFLSTFVDGCCAAFSTLSTSLGFLLGEGDWRKKQVAADVWKAWIAWWKTSLPPAESSSFFLKRASRCSAPNSSEGLWSSSYLVQQAVIAAKWLECVLEFACVWITAEKYKSLFTFSPSSVEFGRDGLIFF